MIIHLFGGVIGGSGFEVDAEEGREAAEDDAVMAVDGLDGLDLS